MKGCGAKRGGNRHSVWEAPSRTLSEPHWGLASLLPRLSPIVEAAAGGQGIAQAAPVRTGLFRRGGHRPHRIFERRVNRQAEDPGKVHRLS